MNKLLNGLSYSLPSMMKRELFNRMAISVALLLAIWATLANSIYDPLTMTITVGSLFMLAYSCLVAIYFFPPLNTILPPRYRILSVLAPQDCVLEEEENVMMGSLAKGGIFAGAGSGHSGKLAAGLHTGKGSSHHGSVSGGGNLSKLNARKLEAIRAAGLSNAQLNRHHHHHYVPPRRSESGGAGVGNESSATAAGSGDGPEQRPSLHGQRSSLDPSVSNLDATTTTSVTSASSQHKFGAIGLGESIGPDRSFVGRLVFVPWMFIIRHRRVFDPVVAVLMVDLAVMCADEGKGNANYARLVMLAIAAIFTMGIIIFPHVKVCSLINFCYQNRVFEKLHR